MSRKVFTLASGVADPRGRPAHRGGSCVGPATPTHVTTSSPCSRSSSRGGSRTRRNRDHAVEYLEYAGQQVLTGRRPTYANDFIASTCPRCRTAASTRRSRRALANPKNAAGGRADRLPRHDAARCCSRPTGSRCSARSRSGARSRPSASPSCCRRSGSSAARRRSARRAAARRRSGARRARGACGAASVPPAARRRTRAAAGGVPR